MAIEPSGEPRGPFAALGRADIYLIDQLMRGRLRPKMRALDAGCGDGRNVELLIRAGLCVFGIDESVAAIERSRAVATAIDPLFDPLRVSVGAIETCTYEAHSFDVVVCNAVLHFARDRAHFDAMVDQLMRVLAPAGLLFVRLATTITIADQTTSLGGGRHRLPDGTERFLVNASDLRALAVRHGAELIDPIKTTNVEGLRAMTTWVVRKR